MEWIIKNLPAPVLMALMPLILGKIGNWFKNKDKNTTGADDAAGNAIHAAIPAVAAFAENDGVGQERVIKKSLKATADSIYRYLGLEPVEFPKDEKE